jgi:hypothetical protein
MFDNSFFDSCFDLVQQLKNRPFLGPFSEHKKVEISISRTKSYSTQYRIQIFFFLLTSLQFHFHLKKLCNLNVIGLHIQRALLNGITDNRINRLMGTN